MKSIHKNRTVKILIAFEAKLAESQNPASINTFEALKNDAETLIPLQLSIAKEQGFVCCYCLSPLKTYVDSQNRQRVQLEIEHYKPKSIFNGKKNSRTKKHLLCDKKVQKRDDLRIEYSNLLGACQTPNQCGNQKRDKELCYIPNPATTKTRDFPKFGYNMKGKIRSLEIDEAKKTTIQNELEDVLGLNNTELKIRRTNRWVGIQRKIKSQFKIKQLHTGGKKEIEYVKDLIQIYTNRDKDNRYFEFYDCIIHLLKREYKDSL